MSRRIKASAAALSARLKALESLSRANLFSEWRQLYRTDLPKRLSRDVLMLGVAWKIQAQVYGGLKPVTKRQLKVLAELFTEAADGIDDANSNEVRDPNCADAPGVHGRDSRDGVTVDRVARNGMTRNCARQLKPGTKLIREWRGETHTVVVLEEGFEWQGSQWRSLSVIACAISGSHRSGPQFFGLHDRTAPRATGHPGDPKERNEGLRYA